MHLSTRYFAALALLVAALLPSGRAAKAAELIVELGNRAETLTTEQLLARPDAATIEVPRDATYGRPMTYRAVPLRALLQAMTLAPGEDLEIVARDGFVTVLPAALVFPPIGGGSVPWLAVEPPDAPWPPPAEGVTTGPFYLVWLEPEARACAASSGRSPLPSSGPRRRPRHAGPRSRSTRASRSAPQSGRARRCS